MTQFIKDHNTSNNSREYSVLCERKGQVPSYVLSKIKHFTNRPFDNHIKDGTVIHCDYDVPLRVFFDNGMEFRLSLQHLLHTEVLYHLPFWLTKDDHRFKPSPNIPSTSPLSHEISLDGALMDWDSIEVENISAHQKLKYLEKIKKTPVHTEADFSKALLLDGGAFEHGKALIAFPNTTLLLNRRDGSGLYWGFVRKLGRADENWLKEDDPNEDLLRPYFFGGGFEVVERLVESSQKVNAIWNRFSKRERLKLKFDSHKRPAQNKLNTQPKFIS